MEPTGPSQPRAAQLATLTKQAKRTAAQDLLGFQLKAATIPHQAEYFWNPRTRQRADYYVPFLEGAGLLVEVDGGLFLQGDRQGGHTRGAARERDYERDATALMLGFTVLRCSPRQVKQGKAIEWITRLLK